jgi:hypothetical protein
MNWNKRLEDGRTVMEHNIEIHEGTAKRHGYTRGENTTHKGARGRRIYCYNLATGGKVIAAATSVGGELMHDNSPMPLASGFSVFIPDESRG